MPIVQATQTFFPNADASRTVFNGECFDSDHPTVKKYPHLFREITADDGNLIEAATAGPGERRSTRRTRKAEKAAEATEVE